MVTRRVRNKDLTIAEVPGDINPGDLGTKHLARDKLNRFIEMLNYRIAPGRAKARPQLSFVGSPKKGPTIKPKR